MNKTTGETTQKPPYKTVGLPADFLDFIEKFIKEHPELGFKSAAEFIKDSVRRRLEDFEKFKNVSEVSS